MKATKDDIVNSFETAYSETPSWEIGRPQGEIVKLEAAGEIHGRVLDVGCGTGENVLYLVKKEYEVIGLDVASTAIKRARKKAMVRGLRSLFLVHDALYLDKIGVKFDTIIDSGLFHVFSDKARRKYVASVASGLRIGGNYFMMCFSEQEPPGWGPRRVTREEIMESFKTGFHINYIKAVKFETNRPEGFAHAWLTAMIRLDRK